MRHLLVGVVAGICLVGSGVPLAATQETTSVRGTISAVGKDSLTVKVKDQEMKFLVDATTEVVAPGAGTKARAAKADGQSGVQFGAMLKAGQSVEVRYHPAAMHAANVRVLGPGAAAPKATEEKPAAEMSAAAKPKSATASGTVTSLTGSSLTLKAAGGESTFVVDNATRVIGTGLGTKSRQEAAAGKKLVLTELVGVGDTVAVTYHEAAGAKHAAEVHLKTKAAK